MTDDKTQLTNETFTLLIDLAFEINNEESIEYAEYRLGEHPDGRRYYEIWTYPKSDTAHKEDE